MFIYRKVVSLKISFLLSAQAKLGSVGVGLWHSQSVTWGFCLSPEYSEKGERKERESERERERESA